jgi:hypothetical protein
MRLAVLLLLVACGSDTKPVSVTSPTVASEPVAAPVKAPPPGTVGVCRADPTVAGVEDRDQPATIAGCPEPMEMFRGNGHRQAELPKVVPSIVPDWDLAGVRDYACAYACAAPGAKAAMLAWSVLEDPRPLRNHYAAFLIDHSPSPKWTVVVMYRHAVNAWWNIGGGIHSSSRPIHDFDHRPTVAEIEAVLDDNAWKFTDDGDGKLLAANVIDETWPGPPERHFPDGIER